MAKSTTERDTPETDGPNEDVSEANVVESDDQHDQVELEKQPPGDDVVTEWTNVPADSTDEADTGTGAGTEQAGKKRGRRARRAAAAARAASNEGSDARTGGSAAKAGDSKAGTGKVSGSKAGTGKVSGSKAGTGKVSGSKAGTGKATSAKSGKAGASGSSGGRRLSATALVRLIVALGVVVLLLAVVLVIQLVKGPGNGPTLAKAEDRREAARQAAENVVPRLFSYDYRQIDANIAEQEKLTLGKINSDITSQTAPALKSLAPKLTAVVQAVSLGSAVLTDDKTGVQVLVFVNQATTNNLLAAPRIDGNRVVVTMQQVEGGQWKVADLKAL
ncbi:MAG TPA: hypothetical protein VLR26_02360 [Frankiaceae bacterium]|nr:hypothetical protein [Frankiaceae bacterium]